MRRRLRSSVTLLCCLGPALALIAAVTATAAGKTNWTILPESQGRLFLPDAQPMWTPSADQVGEAEARLPLYLRHQGHEQTAAGLGTHLRQYFGFIRGGRRLIYVSVFPREIVDFVTCKGEPQRERPACRPADYWRSEAIGVQDGGDDVWHAEYDPTSKEWGALTFNGVA